MFNLSVEFQHLKHIVHIVALSDGLHFPSFPTFTVLWQPPKIWKEYKKLTGLDMCNWSICLFMKSYQLLWVMMAGYHYSFPEHNKAE